MNSLSPAPAPDFFSCKPTADSDSCPSSPGDAGSDSGSADFAAVLTRMKEAAAPNSEGATPGAKKKPFEGDSVSALVSGLIIAPAPMAEVAADAVSAKGDESGAGQLPAIVEEFTTASATGNGPIIPA